MHGVLFAHWAELLKLKTLLEFLFVFEGAVVRRLTGSDGAL